MKITPIIGLEVHVELKTKTKMFCGCDANHFHVDPNTHTCPVCLGLPGALPVPNKTACDWTIKLGLALNCEINKQSFFERKNYFYPDSTKGYQISQLQKPFAINGKLNIDGHEIRINRAHLEEDAGKSVHVADSTLLDFNRCGVALVEIVSEPDITSPEVAKKYLLKIQQIIRYIGVSDADIEKGSMRCEPTVNLCIDDKFYTPLVEIKNVASLTGVMNAIGFEIKRQTDQFNEDHIEKNSTNKVTRGWDADKGQTFPQREKEGSDDYRYFPEPDIPPIEYSDAEIESIRSTLPELPDQKIARYKSYGLSDYDSNLLAENKEFSEKFDSVTSNAFAPDISGFQEYSKFVANIFNGVLRTHTNETNTNLDISKMTPRFFWETFESIQKSEISNSVAKQVILESYQLGKHPVEIAKEKGLLQVSNTDELKRYAEKVIVNNAKAVEDYKKNPMSIGFLVGQVMKESAGTANPQMAKEILEKLLK